MRVSVGTVGDGVQRGATAGQDHTIDVSGARTPGFQLGRNLIQTLQHSILPCGGIPASQGQTLGYSIRKTDSSSEAQCLPPQPGSQSGGAVLKCPVIPAFFLHHAPSGPSENLLRGGTPQQCARAGTPCGTPICCRTVPSIEKVFAINLPTCEAVRYLEGECGSLEANRTGLRPYAH